MHTDEYEISLSRELAVCKSAMKRIKEFLAIIERKHGMSTEDFINKFRDGTLSPEYRDDYEAWKNNYESLKQWEELQRQYEQVFHVMKISRRQK
jgi:hypothetical protein